MPWEPLPQSSPDPQPVTKGLESVMSRLVGASDAPASIPAVEVLFERWSDLVGADLAGVSRPVRIEGRRLVVEVTDAAFGTELRWRERAVLERLGEIAGESPVTGFKVLVKSR